MSPYFIPKPKIMRTPNLAYELIGVHQNFLKNWLWVDDVTILTSRPIFKKLRHF